MNHEENILLYGGKAASLLAQYETKNDDFLLPFTLIQKERGTRLPNFTNSQIIRGTAVGDEKGLVDILLTKISRTPEEMSTCIEEIVNQSRKEEVKKYAKWEGLQEYKGTSSVIIQPYNTRKAASHRRGSVVEHPNIKGHYLINIVYDVSDCPNGTVDQFLADEEGNIVATTTFPRNSMENEQAKNVKAIVAMKKRSRKAGFIPEENSSQVEFGFLERELDEREIALYEYQTNPTNPILFYQERLFLPFDFDPSIKVQNYRFNQFGKIPEDKTVLRIVKCEGEFVIENLTDIMEKSKDNTPSVYVFNTAAVNGALPLAFQPNNMVGFVVPVNITASGTSLEHGNYRWIQKAQFSLLGLDFLTTFDNGGTFLPSQKRDISSLELPPPF